MTTEILTVNEGQIDLKKIAKAGEILKKGGLVAFPTETVYGLGADALNQDSALKTYQVKGRPTDNPLIIHIAQVEDIEKITVNRPEIFKPLASTFWPGPLTLILEKSPRVPLGTTGGLDTVAVRMPQNKIALALIQAAGGFVSAPSANSSGRPSPTTAKHVAEDLWGKIEMIVDGGSVDIGVESTILDITVFPPVILRPGAITKEMLEEIIGEVNEAVISEDSLEGQAPKAPGMKYLHYAPKGKLSIVQGSPMGVRDLINQLAAEKIQGGKKVGIIATEESASDYVKGTIKIIGQRKDLDSVAKNLYGILREFDEEGIEYIYSESFPLDGIGTAIMNRLEKAAGFRRINAK